MAEQAHGHGQGQTQEQAQGQAPWQAQSSPFTQVPVEVTVCVGRARPRVRDLLRLGPGGVLTLDRGVDDPVELYVGDRLIARGELVETEEGPPGQLAVRLTEIVSLEDRA